MDALYSLAFLALVWAFEVWRVMAGGNSHQRAVTRAAGRVKTVPAPVHEVSLLLTSEPKSIWKRLLDFIKNPIVLAGVFLVMGLIGAFIFTPALIVCAICILFGFYRAKVVSGPSVYSGFSLGVFCRVFFFKIVRCERAA